MTIFKRLTFFIVFILPALICSGYNPDAWWNYVTIAFAFLLIHVIDYPRLNQWENNIDHDSIPA